MVEELKYQNQKLTDKIDELLKKNNFVVSDLPMDKIIGDANKNNSTVEIETIKYLIKVMDLSEEELKELKDTIDKLQKELEAVKNIHNSIEEKATAIAGESKNNNSKPVDKIGVTLYIDEKYYTENFTVNDKLKVMDTKPFIGIDDRTMVPIRFVSESLDAKVDWIPESNEAIIESKDGLKVSFKIGTDRMTINGIDAQADTATILKDNRTFVPVRLVSELFGYRVEWEPVFNRVKIKE
ncbi:copper amine oxidase N-terminal domain-containing protein [Vallitalea guaymasensis]|uniref:copper amine oxidase N-terminal domain-containing protein n=1 Tax=Vallitalea guaymasensis TaxID=1185412 RepID=UPI000DE50700|nr:copper amine oxidase N-terminal domain-containing protein [Vallitalea guaymasensis]